MFDAARLRLTVWYLLIVALIVGALSLALYELVLIVQQSGQAMVVHGAARQTLDRVFAHDDAILAYQFVGLDLVVLVLSALGAYFLAGRSLRPIQAVMLRQRRFAA